MNKKAQQSTSLQTILKGGVPLAFVLFGIGLIIYVMVYGATFGHFLLGLISAGLGAFLFYKHGAS